MTKRQRVFFRIGAWACLATAGIHLIGHFAPQPAPPNETEATLWRLMTTYERDLGAGFSRTTMDFLKGFSLTFSLFLFWVGGLALTLVKRPPQDPRFWSRIRLAYAIFSGALLGISLTYFFLPPIVCVAVVFLAFAVAALPAGNPPGRGA